MPAINWFLGKAEPPPDSLSFHLPSEQESFCAIIIFLKKLNELLVEKNHTSETMAQITKIKQVVYRETSDHALSDSVENASSVAFSVIRRISRESVFTADIIDSTARLILKMMTDINQPAICLHNIDRIDRPSIKIFSRLAVLGHEKKSWNWFFASNPLSYAGDLFFFRSRKLLFSRILNQLNPKLHLGSSTNSQVPQIAEKKISIIDAAGELVIQNYDHCAIMLKNILTNDEKNCEALKLLALAYVNVGLYEESIVALDQAISCCVDPILKSSMYYTKGLVLQKRKHSALAALNTYQEGLSSLKDFKIESESDYNNYTLERSWLNNGICLYNAIKIKTQPSDELFANIYNTLCKCLSDLSSVYTNDAIYLKSNLISNASFLLEIKKNYKDSYTLLSAYYDDIADLNKRDLKSCHINYRLGTLQLKMKNYSSALVYYNKCLESLQCIPRPLLHEKLCRVISIAHLGLNKPKKAMNCLKQGLKICIEQCSEKGITYYNHAIETLGEPVDFNSIPPKLPAFIPEIDLEDIPPINLNEYLAK